MSTDYDLAYSALQPSVFVLQGISGKRDTCQTCDQRLADCTGHFGMQAQLPVRYMAMSRVQGVYPHASLTPTTALAVGYAVVTDCPKAMQMCCASGCIHTHS